MRPLVRGKLALRPCFWAAYVGANFGGCGARAGCGGGVAWERRELRESREAKWRWEVELGVDVLLRGPQGEQRC
eukprot:4994168-Prymnesium_polylepis.1